MQLITDNRKMTVLWLLRILAAAFLLLFLALELLHVLPLIGILVGAAALSAAAIFGCWYIPAYFRRYAVYLDGNTVRITHGVVSVRTTVLPLHHVLTAAISASPAARLFRLRLVILGLPSHRYYLYAVREKDAERLLVLCEKSEGRV